MEEPIPKPPAPQPPASSFIHLPLELRNMVYDLLIAEAIVSKSPPSGVPSWDIRAFNSAHQYDLQITAKRVKYANLRLPSYLIYTCHQVYSELSTLISSRIHHMRLTGDFLLGLSPTEAIFSMLARRPWIADSIRTVNIDLKLNHVLPVLGGVAVNSKVLEQHPWLDERLKIAEVRVGKFEMKGRGMEWVPQGWLQTVMAPRWSLNWCLERMGMKGPVREEVLEFEVEGEAEGRGEGHEHNTLPDLAKLFETFPQLGKIDIETEHQHLLSLFPPPNQTAESFKALDKRGVEVNVLVKHWQMHSFCNMLYRNGIERGTMRFSTEGRSGNVALSYFNQRDGGMRGHRVVSFRLVDRVLRPESEMGDEGKREERVERWKKFGGMWLWRRKFRGDGDGGVEDGDATSADPNSENETIAPF